jgi:FixJ family two-component response regulator
LVLVDDDPAVLHALTFAFEIDGYAVSGFGSGEALLASDLPSDPVCYVLDEKLPGMSGLDLHAQLRSRGERAPVILITSNPSAYLRSRAAAAGIDLVEKPLLGSVLAGKVRALSAAAQARDDQP